MPGASGTVIYSLTNTENYEDGEDLRRLETFRAVGHSLGYQLKAVSFGIIVGVTHRRHSWHGHVLRMA